jgi:hypothetical protein
VLFEEFRDDVKPLVEAWLAEDPMNNSNIGSPFDDPSYTVIDTVDMATRPIDDAEIHTTVALEARSNVGNYTLTSRRVRRGAAPGRAQPGNSRAGRCRSRWESSQWCCW